MASKMSTKLSSLVRKVRGRTKTAAAMKASGVPRAVKDISLEKMRARFK